MAGDLGEAFAFLGTQAGQLLLDRRLFLVSCIGQLLVELGDLLLQAIGEFLGRFHALGGCFLDALELDRGVLEMFGRRDEPLELLAQFLAQRSCGVLLVPGIVDDVGNHEHGDANHDAAGDHEQRDGRERI